MTPARDCVKMEAIGILLWLICPKVFCPHFTFYSFYFPLTVGGLGSACLVVTGQSCLQCYIWNCLLSSLSRKYIFSWAPQASTPKGIPKWVEKGVHCEKVSETLRMVVRSVEFTLRRGFRNGVFFKLPVLVPVTMLSATFVYSAPIVSHTVLEAVMKAPST